MDDPELGSVSETVLVETFQPTGNILADSLAAASLSVPDTGPALSTSKAATPVLHDHGRSRSTALQHWEHAQLTSLAASHIHPTTKRKQ